MDEFTGNYIYLDEAVEFWHVNSRGNASYTRYTTEEYASFNLTEIHLIGGIRNDNKLWERRFALCRRSSQIAV